jgi:hypothetical protein
MKVSWRDDMPIVVSCLGALISTHPSDHIEWISHQHNVFGNRLLTIACSPHLNIDNDDDSIIDSTIRRGSVSPISCVTNVGHRPAHEEPSRPGASSAFVKPQLAAEFSCCKSFRTASAKVVAGVAPALSSLQPSFFFFAPPSRSYRLQVL